MSLVHPDIPSYFYKLIKYFNGSRTYCIPVETLLDHGISASANVSKSSVAWLIRKMLMEN